MIIHNENIDQYTKSKSIARKYVHPANVATAAG